MPVRIAAWSGACGGAARADRNSPCDPGANEPRQPTGPAPARRRSCAVLYLAGTLFRGPQYRMILDMPLRARRKLSRYREIVPRGARRAAGRGILAAARKRAVSPPSRRPCIRRARRRAFDFGSPVPGEPLFRFPSRIRRSKERDAGFAEPRGQGPVSGSFRRRMAVAWSRGSRCRPNAFRTQRTVAGAWPFAEGPLRDARKTPAPNRTGNAPARFGRVPATRRGISAHPAPQM